MSTIVVTGSSGFIGRAVCEAFVKDGHAVVGFDRPGGGKPPAGATNIPCDVTSEDGSLRGRQSA